MARPFDHPNEPGKWTLLERQGDIALWRRERSDPVPLTLFYVLAPPRQAQVLYEAELAKAGFLAMASKQDDQAA